jgi:glycosyltransferase involved in cell wall biosynthesis
MDILMVTLAYDPAIAFGGPVKIVQNNARELVRRGHKVTVYCTNRLDKKNKIAPDTIEREDQGVRVVYHNNWFIPWWKGNFGPFFSWSIIRYLYCEGKRFDIIHINEARAFTTLVAALYAQYAKIPYIIQAHGSFIYGLRSHRLKRIYDRVIGRRIYSKVARVIASSPVEISECESVGIPRHKITLIGNGIDLTTWQVRKEDGVSFRKRFGIPLDAYMVLFLSRLDKKKGPDLVVEALAQLKVPKVYCVFAGPDDGYREYVQQLAINYGLSDRVIFTGLLRDGEVRAAYAAADVFVLPSRFDTFPMAIVESLASGLPVVITETCQVAELIREKAGLVTPVEPTAVANALERLLCDPDLRKTYAIGARTLAEREFSVQKTVDRLEEVYQQVLEEHRLS